MAEKSIHSGHRKLKKEQIMLNGVENTPEHELLEALLFYAQPRVYTNPIGHALINRFKTLKGVLEASYDELLEVEGVGPNSAGLISYVGSLSRRYVQLSAADSLDMNNTESIRSYCEAKFQNVRTEKILCLCLNHNLQLVSERFINEGSVGQVNITPRAIAETALKNECEIVIIAHNHPQGTCMPSRQDTVVTKSLFAALKQIDISLIDHIITGKDGSWSMRQSGALGTMWEE